MSDGQTEACEANRHDPIMLAQMVARRAPCFRAEEQEAEREIAELKRQLHNWQEYAEYCRGIAFDMGLEVIPYPSFVVSGKGNCK